MITDIYTAWNSSACITKLIEVIDAQDRSAVTSATVTITKPPLKAKCSRSLDYIYCLEQSFAVQSKSLLCVVYDELVLTHEYARASGKHSGWRYLFGGTENQGEHISPLHLSCLSRSGL